MPSFNVKAPDGTTYKLTPPEGASDVDIQEQINKLVAAHGGPAPTASGPTPPEPASSWMDITQDKWPPQMPPSIPALPKVSEAVDLPNRLVEGALQGGMEAVKAPFRLVGALANAPQAISDLASQPSEIIPAVRRGVMGMLPGGPTVNRMMETGQIPPVRDIAADVSMAGASQVLGRVVPEALMRGGRRVAMSLPGSSVELHSLGAQELEKFAESLRPEKAAMDAAYAKLKAEGNPTVPMNAFRQKVSDLIARERIKPLADQDQNWIDYLDTHFKDSQNGWNFDRVQAGAQHLGQNLGKFQSTTAGARVGATTAGATRQYAQQLKEMIGAIHEDVRNAPNANLDPAWKEATKMWRRDMAATGFERDVIDATGVTGDGFTTLGGLNKLIKKVRNAQSLARLGNKAESLWVDSFDPGEVNKMLQTLVDLRKRLPVISKGRGVITGSSQVIPRALAGYAAGEAFGAGPVSGSIGAATATWVPRMIARGMMTDKGRAFIRSAVEFDPTMGPVFRNTLAAFLRTQSSLASGQQPEDMAASAPTAVPAPRPAPTPTPQQELARASADLKDKQLREADQAVTR